MIKKKKNQNISCYSFIISLVSSLLSLNLRDIILLTWRRVIQTFDLGKVGLAIFYHLSRLCLQHYIPRSSNTIKMETTVT